MSGLGLSGPQGLALGRLPLLGAVLRSRAATLGFAIVAAWAVVAALAPWLAPYDPTIIDFAAAADPTRSEEHTSELQSLMRISYAVFCLKKKTPVNTKLCNTLSVYDAQLSS